MGTAQSTTQLEAVNKLHNNIELIVQLNTNGIAQNKKLIKSTLKELTKCTFYMQISHDKLIQCVYEHVKCWTNLNNVKIDEAIYVEHTCRQIERLLNEYNSFTITL